MDSNTKLLLTVLAIAAFVTVIGIGSFLAEAKDNYYNYVPSYPTSVKQGEPITFSVKMQEKNRILVDCDKDGMGNRISPDTAHYCASFTYFNARSIRVYIDGAEYANLYFYPQIPMNASPLAISSPLPDIGPVSCFGAIGYCSVTADQDRSGLQYQRAYFFGRRMNPQTSLDGTSLLSISIPQNLPAGTHTVAVQYFAETTSHANDNTVTPEYYVRLGGQQMGDNNNRYNYYEQFDVNVTGSASPPPPANDSWLIAAGVAVAAILLMRMKFHSQRLI